MDGAAAPTFSPTARSRVRRRPDRAAYDEATVFGVLDAGLMAHVGYVMDGQPFVTPTAYWREGRTLYWHGAAASRMLAAISDGVRVCVTVSFLDGLIVGRSGITHSVNYRSAMCFGRAMAVSDPVSKRAAMEAFINRLYAGRSVKLRPTNEAELAAISLVKMDIEEASAKVKSTGPTELPADEGWTAWAGVLPVETRIGPALAPPEAGPRTEDLSPYSAGARLEEALTRACRSQHSG